MSDIYARADRNSERRIQASIDGVHFNELYQTAVEVFLRTAPEDSLDAELTESQRIVALCGVRGLAAALDGSRRDQYFTPYDEGEDGQSFFISTDSIIRHPRAFSASLDPNIQNKIEALGAGLLKEAYTVLGTDAKPHVEMYRNATTVEEQIAVLEWLDKRCRQISTLEKSSTGDNIDYHPARLSPKLVGQFPHNKLKPTCLGYGIIIASFLSQAGAPVLHAGIANTHYDTLRTFYYDEAVNTYHDALGAGQPTIAEAAKKAHTWGKEDYKDVGFHVANYTRLLDGSWYGVDPNYNLSRQLSVEDSKRVQHAYEDLTEVSALAKGVEIPVRFVHNSASVTILEVLDAARSHTFDLSEIRRILTGDDTESLSYRVYKELATQYLDLQEDNTSPEAERLLQFLSPVDGEVESNGLFSLNYCSEFLAAWDTHVQHGMDTDDMMALCKNDQNFLQRRLEDIQMLPTLALQGLLACELDNFVAGITKYKNKHEFVEVGLPAYRIGCSVLSDLAVYTDAPLSPQFFLSYWPSRVPATETRGAVARDRTGVLRANMIWLDHTDFFYTQQYGIIKRHLADNPPGTKE